MADPNRKSRPAPTGMTSTTILALGLMRSAIGLGCLIAPTLTCSAFFVDIGSEGPGTLLTRLVGGRDLALGALLLYTRGGASGTSSALALRGALLAGVLTDSLDVVSCLIAELGGAVGWEAAGIFGGGAAAFAGMGLLGLSSV